MATSSITCSGGIFLSQKTKRFLFLLRAHGKTAGTWGIVGGKQEPQDNTLYETLKREMLEELGFTPAINKTIPLELFESNDQKFQYNTYVLLVDDEFIPKLNNEHKGYAWCNYFNWPNPLHKGLKNSLYNKITRAKLELLLDII